MTAYAIQNELEQSAVGRRVKAEGTSGWGDRGGARAKI